MMQPLAGTFSVRDVAVIMWKKKLTTWWQCLPEHIKARLLSSLLHAGTNLIYNVETNQQYVCMCETQPGLLFLLSIPWAMKVYDFNLNWAQVVPG